MVINSVSGNQINYHNSTRADRSEVSQNFKTTATEFSVQPPLDILKKEKFELSISEEAIVKAIERANKAIDGEPRQVEFSVHNPGGEIVVKLVHAETKEVIREFPPEKLLEMLDKFKELNGKIVDERR